ncbi:MAG: MogA/MoaB family molybdenum cofactor biosynthesis protein [Bowdeniella nasicola]|nr:MogA/MoaB family molybdenum cofactor biosynthesis protein [Bowdeniella nasicola]
MSETKKIIGKVITVSDRCASGETEDTSGPLAVSLLAEYGVECDHIIVVPDDSGQIAGAMQEAISGEARIIFTTGGTGISRRDVTPDATGRFISLPLDGLAHQIRMHGLKNTPFATLSRAQVGLTSRHPGAALVVNAPGSNGGVKDAISVVGPLIDHILAIIDHEPDARSVHERD